MKNILLAFSLCVLPVTAMAEDNLNTFGVNDDLSVDGDAFMDGIYALQGICMDSNQPVTISLCERSDDSIEAILDQNMCLDLYQLPNGAMNECQAAAALSILGAVQYQFNQHLLNDGKPCTANDNLQCFTVEGRVFAFPKQPA